MAAGITSIEALELTEAHQIDMTLSRNPPFGLKLLGRVEEFPKLTVYVKMMGKVVFRPFNCRSSEGSYADENRT